MKHPNAPRRGRTTAHDPHANAKPTHRVIGVAPGHSGWSGRTVELGLCYSEEHANRCVSFWWPHYDDIQVIELTD